MRSPIQFVLPHLIICTRKYDMSLGLKLAFLAISMCMMISGHYPPAQAQTQRVFAQFVSPLSAEDVGQDHDIIALNLHIAHTDALVEGNTAALQEYGKQLAGISGEERAFGTLLTFLTIVQLVMSRKKAAV